MKPQPARKDESHSFSVNVAIAIGDRKALLLKELYGWCLKNWHNGKNIKDGLPWTYNSSAAFAKKFPYWSEKSIGRWLREMEADGLIKSANYNKMRIDKTKWYTVNFEAYDYMVDNKQLDKNQCSKWVKALENTIAQNGQSLDNSEECFDHNEQDKTHNERPIPSLTISYPSYKNGGKEKTTESDDQQSLINFAELNIEQLKKMGAVGVVRHAVQLIAPDWIWQKSDNYAAEEIYRYFSDKYKAYQAAGKTPTIKGSLIHEKEYQVRAIRRLFKELPEWERTNRMDVAYIAKNLNSILEKIKTQPPKNNKTASASTGRPSSRMWKPSDEDKQHMQKLNQKYQKAYGNDN